MCSHENSEHESKLSNNACVQSSSSKSEYKDHNTCRYKRYIRKRKAKKIAEEYRKIIENKDQLMMEREFLYDILKDFGNGINNIRKRLMTLEEFN